MKINILFKNENPMIVLITQNRQALHTCFFCFKCVLGFFTDTESAESAAGKLVELEGWRVVVLIPVWV